MLATASKGNSNDNNEAESIILTLYNTSVQPYLGGCVQFWFLHLKKDIARLEMVWLK